MNLGTEMSGSEFRLQAEVAPAALVAVSGVGAFDAN